jgi:hypothetical protein
MACGGWLSSVAVTTGSSDAVARWVSLGGRATDDGRGWWAEAGAVPVCGGGELWG